MTTRYLPDVIVFDLDDTLYKERDYVLSGFRAVAARLGHPDDAARMYDAWLKGDNAFDLMAGLHPQSGISVAEMVAAYRAHMPDITLAPDVADTLERLSLMGKTLGLITDGRSVAQRNKIQALGLLRWIDPADICISEEFGSEKPCEANYRLFMDRHPGRSYMYVGDNTAKDFIAPNALGWQTICLLDPARLNIHPQDLTRPVPCLPCTTITSLAALL